MGYFQKYLEGEGTKAKPFLIYSYEDYMVVDPRHSVDVDPPYYKLMNDINMSARNGYLRQMDFLNGYLNMNDHSIISPRVPKGQYLIKNCNIYSNDLEVVGQDGVIHKKGGCGQFLDIRGGAMQYVFNACTFKRIYVDLNAEGMFINDSSQTQVGLISRAKAEQTHFNIRNVGYHYGMITAGYDSNDYSFVDTCFEFHGETYDVPLIDFGYSDPSSTDKILNRCMICGTVNCENMSYAYGSCPYPIVKGKVENSVFYLFGKYDRDQKGYGGYADTISSDYVSIGIDPTDSGLYVKNQTGVSIVSAEQIVNPTYLQSINFDVLNINKEG